MTSSREFFRSILEGYRGFFANLLRFIAAAVLIALTSAVIAFPLWFLAIQHTSLYTRLLVGFIIGWLAFRSVRRRHLTLLLLRGVHIGGILLAAYAATAAFLYDAILIGLLASAAGLFLFGLLIRRKPESA